MEFISEGGGAEWATSKVAGTVLSGVREEVMVGVEVAVLDAEAKEGRDCGGGWIDRGRAWGTGPCLNKTIPILNTTIKFCSLF